MLIADAIRGARALRGSAIPEELLIKWLSDFDGQEWEKVIRHYGPGPKRPEYGETTDREAVELLIEAPWDGIYLDYLIMMIDFYNGDPDRYNGEAAMVNKRRQEWADNYNRTHAWVPSVREIRF